MKSVLNLGSDPTTGLRVERGHCGRLRPYWYNGQYLIYTPAPAARR